MLIGKINSNQQSLKAIVTYSDYYDYIEDTKTPLHFNIFI